VPCNHVILPGGAHAIICGRGSRPRPCSVCGRPHSKLCDFPLRGAKAGKTCDRTLCDQCAVHQEPDLDYCPAHAKLLGVACAPLR
jgi:hypothetical protein